MAYIPVAQLQKRETGYVPIAQLRGKKPKPEIDLTDFRLAGTGLTGIETTTPAILPEGTLTQTDLLKAIAQGTARQWAATGAKIAQKIKLVSGDKVDPKTFFGISPTARSLGVAIFGREEPFNATSEDVEFLETFGVPKEVTEKFGGSLTFLFSTLDVAGAAPFKGAVGLVRALKRADNFADAGKALRSVGFIDEVIESYAPLFVKAKTTKEVKNLLDAAIDIQSKTTKVGYRPVKSLAKEAVEVTPRIIDETLEPLTQEAQKIAARGETAERFVKDRAIVPSLLSKESIHGPQARAKFTGEVVKTGNTIIDRLPKVLEEGKKIDDVGGDGSVGNYASRQVAKLIKNGRLIVYHGTTEKTADILRGNAWSKLNDGSYLSLTKTAEREALGVYGAGFYKNLAEKYGQKGEVLKFEIPIENIGVDKTTGELRFINPNTNLTKSQLTDFYNQAVRGVEPPRSPIKPPERLPSLPRVPKPSAEPPTLAQIKRLGEDVKTLAGKSKEEIIGKIEELRGQLSIVEEITEEMPGGKLTRFISRKEGEFLDFKNPNLAETSVERQRIIERNKKVLKASESAFEGTLKADLFDDLDTIREAIEEYQKAKARIADVKTQISELVGERVTLSKGEAAAGIGMQQRRIQYRATQERWQLSDNEMKRFLHGRNISAMETDEWRAFLKEADIFGEQAQRHSEAMTQLKAIIEHKDLKKWDNIRAALGLPPIHQMNTEQLVNFEKILYQYKTGDEFLPVRMLQTIKNTELAGAKTTREVLEALSKRSGKAVENMPIKPTEWHRTLGDRRLARQHPFLEFMVERKNRSLVEAEARIIELSDELDGLVKESRASRKRGLIERLIPTDENIVRWAETADVEAKAILEKTMTKEEIVVAKRWDEIRRSYYDYLVKRHAEQKFSRFEGQYFPHVRRGFLESWKDDGIVKAFLEMRDRYRQDAFTMNILNEQTQEILPYEKWIGFAQFRTNKLIPTQNAARAFEAYIAALEKAKHLDEMTPEIMAYVHSLSPRNFSQHGIELDISLKKFVKEYINANKGRVPKGFFNPGGGFDVGNRSLMALTRMIDLGWNFSTQIAAPIGENLMTLTMLKPQAYEIAQKRAFMVQGRAIVGKYKNFIGRTPWDEMTRAANDIGDKFMAGAFSIFGQSTRSTNKLFLLGKMTGEEFKTGVISSQRLAELRIEMSKYRHIRGMESILGRTTEAQALKQYKSWAIPPLTATVENATELVKIIRRDGVAKALGSNEGKELFYSIGIGSAIGLLTYGTYKELQEKGGKRSFMEDVAYKAMRDAVTIFGAFDPTMWSGVRTADFLEDLAKATLDLIMLEEYKTTGELKAPKEFQRALTPVIIRRFTPEEEKKAPSGGRPMNAILKDFGLPPLPELPELPSLPKLPVLTP